MKGFHAVALCNGVFERTSSKDPAGIANWCLQWRAAVVAVDAPCGWSRSGVSRLAERALKLGTERIQCFSTPSRARALAHKRGFYDWVFNGEALYQHLVPHYPLFDGELRSGPLSFETFPHAIVCALAGKVVAAKPKVASRRGVLRRLGYACDSLPNVDFVDAALCAVAAGEFLQRRIRVFGERGEGFIVLPALDVSG